VVVWEAVSFNGDEVQRSISYTMPTSGATSSGPTTSEWRRTLSVVRAHLAGGLGDALA
jgi:predicted secreted Zn-dependent protease